MTQRKKFQKRVRTQMKETGTNYTEAALSISREGTPPSTQSLEEALLLEEAGAQEGKVVAVFRANTRDPHASPSILKVSQPVQKAWVGEVSREAWVGLVSREAYLKGPINDDFEFDEEEGTPYPHFQMTSEEAEILDQAWTKAPDVDHDA